MVTVPIDRGFESNQTKIGICCFSAQYAALGRKSIWQCFGNCIGDVRKLLTQLKIFINNIVQKYFCGTFLYFFHIKDPLLSSNDKIMQMSDSCNS
jgi:hypothetical protein